MDGPEVQKGYAASERQAAADGEEDDGGEQPVKKAAHEMAWKTCISASNTKA